MAIAAARRFETTDTTVGHKGSQRMKRKVHRARNSWIRGSSDARRWKKRLLARVQGVPGSRSRWWRRCSDVVAGKMPGNGPRWPRVHRGGGHPIDADGRRRTARHAPGLRIAREAGARVVR